MKYIKRVESREIVDQTQTQGYVLRFDPMLYVTAFTQKDFHYVHRGPSTKEGPPSRNYNLHTGSTQLQLSLTLLHKRVGTKQRKDYNLVIT